GLAALLEQPSGLVLIAGPSGGGKTTTVYAALAYLAARRSGAHLSIEDPVEQRLRLAGIPVDQVELSPERGLDAEAALVGALRQDVDVVALSEIRTAGEAALAVKAAHTGRLVVAGLHAGSATEARQRMLDLDADPPAIDREWWQTIGMQRSETHLVRWSGSVIREDGRIGEPGSYAREPFFSGGALRFAAVHAGGIAGLLDAVRDHLTTHERASDPFQASRLADLFLLAQGAAASIRDTAGAWFSGTDAERLARVSAARLSIAGSAERALTIAQEAVGLQGLFLSHPLAAKIADLMVYLRQPAPDAHRFRVGQAVAEHILDPIL
ncbi:ATPase, T2SS/T4P/T4SS family, partial [Sphingomonas sp.]|uniref:ATPase, T2SS/T4P/T4SS family n=1 Tax=Sphingomonas sp. TaxID=28214 RepID=UPI0025832FEB